MVGMRSVSKRTSRKQPDLRTEEDGPTFPSSEQRSKRCRLHREPIESLASNSVINDTVTVGRDPTRRGAIPTDEGFRFPKPGGEIRRV